jgi:hypothetical protein
VIDTLVNAGLTICVVTFAGTWRVFAANFEHFLFVLQLFQDDLEAQQQKVNSLTHMVVVVDDNANDNATAELEEQLGILGERWSSVCKWTEERYPIFIQCFIIVKLKFCVWNVNEAGSCQGCSCIV